MFFLERAVVLNKRSIHHRILAVSMDQACDPVSTILHVFPRTDGIDDFAMVSAARVGFGAYSVSGTACVIRRERSDKESKGIAAYGYPAGTPGAPLPSSASCYERMVNGRRAVNL